MALTFEEATGKNVILLPVGRSDDGAHSQNEKLDRCAVTLWQPQSLLTIALQHQLHQRCNQPE